MSNKELLQGLRRGARNCHEDLDGLEKLMQEAAGLISGWQRVTGFDDPIDFLASTKKTGVAPGKEGTCYQWQGENSMAAPLHWCWCPEGEEWFIASGLDIFEGEFFLPKACMPVRPGFTPDCADVEIVTSWPPSGEIAEKEEPTDLGATVISLLTEHTEAAITITKRSYGDVICVDLQSGCKGVVDFSTFEEGSAGLVRSLVSNAEVLFPAVTEGKDNDKNRKG